MLCLLISITSCSKADTETADTQPDIKERLISAADNLERSKLLYFKNGLKITGLGINYSGNATKKSDNFYWSAIEKMTGVSLDIFWTDRNNYLSSLSTTLLTGIDEMPDIINASNFGVMDLADDNIIIPLDEYLDLMPDIVAAVGEDRLNYLRQTDGHIYTIPSITDIPGAKTMMVRKDWLDKLGLTEPETWDEWVNLWRAIRDNDLNGNGDTTDEIPFASQFGDNGERCLLPLLNAFGIRTSGDTQFCLLDDGTYTLIYEHPRYPEFLEAVQGLYKEGLICSDFDLMYLDNLYTAMDGDRLGTTFDWAERCRTSSEALRESGVTDALWKAVQPITGPDGTRMTPERNMVTSMWCITSAAKKSRKAEDIVRFFNWCFTEEGSYLYSYGIEGVSYEIKNGVPTMSKELTANGFTDYRAAGCSIESFGGLMQEGAFTQCLFENQSVEEMDELTEEFYRGICVVNNDYFYTVPKTYQTAAYIKYRNQLITEGICHLRNQAIKGEITVEQFYEKYEKLKKQGLQEIIDEAAATAN